MEQGTIEIKLPSTGETVVMSEYLTTGQSRDLQRLLLSKGQFNANEGKFENIPTEAYLDMQDRAVGFVIKKIKKADGSAVDYSKDWLDNLPIQDGNVIFEKVNKIIEASNISPEGKKK